MKPNPQHEQEKQLQKQKDNEQAAKSYCRTCKKEIFPAFDCRCSGGGPGGGSSGGSGGDDNNSNKSVSSINTASAIPSDNTATSFSNGKHENVLPKPVLTRKEILLKIIAELLAKKLFTIDDHKTLHTLTIKCDPAQLSELQREAVKDFIQEIKNQFEDFKDKNGLTANDYRLKQLTDAQGNITSLQINIPHLSLYNKFIEQLQQNNLIPSQVTNQQEQPSNNEPKKPFHPTPLSTTLKPKWMED